MGRKYITVEEAEQRHPDLIKNQKIRGIFVKYKYLCEKHGMYLQSLHRRDNGGGCYECRKINWKSRKSEGLSKIPEYITVMHHFYKIFNPKYKGHKCYKNMPFFEGWNPKKGGSWLLGMRWIIENLGERPKGTSMHIVEHEKGFVPGNLEWTHPRKQSTQQMFKIIADLKHRIKELEHQIESQEKA